MSYPLTAIISDLHGNVPALSTALADARERGVRRYVCLGDVVGYGARPRECLDVVMKMCVRGAVDPETGEPLEDGLCLLGNHEHALLLQSAEDFNPKARAAIEWTRDQLNGSRERRDAYWDFIGELRAMSLDERAMFAHGSPREPVREYLLPRDVHDRPKLAANFAAMERDVCFVGHSHVPAVYYQDFEYYLPRDRDPNDSQRELRETKGPFELGVRPDRRAIVNVGSVGQPRDGDNRLSYVIFDGSRVTFVRLAYDHERASQEIRDVPELPDYLADRLAVGR